MGLGPWTIIVFDTKFGSLAFAFLYLEAHDDLISLHPRFVE